MLAQSPNSQGIRKEFTLVQLAPVAKRVELCKQSHAAYLGISNLYEILDNTGIVN